MNMPNCKTIGQELRPVAWVQANCDIQQQRQRHQADGITPATSWLVQKLQLRAKYEVLTRRPWTHMGCCYI